MLDVRPVRAIGRKELPHTTKVEHRRVLHICPVFFLVPKICVSFCEEAANGSVGESAEDCRPTFKEDQSRLTVR